MTFMRWESSFFYLFILIGFASYSFSFNFLNNVMFSAFLLSEESYLLIMILYKIIIKAKLGLFLNKNFP